MRRILHVLSQRPGHTGSGVTLDALVRHGAAAGYEQAVVGGVPAGEEPEVGGLARECIHPLEFGAGELGFAVPGMSDVMPYPSTRFAAMDADMLRRYRGGWRRHLGRVCATFRPERIHVHHVWLVAAMIKGVVPEVPVVNHCHATGLRQLRLCPHLAGEVRVGCARNERFVVLHRGHAEELQRELGVSGERITVVGAGYREDLFHPRGRAPRDPPRVAYVGKYSEAKGLPFLLDAWQRGGFARRAELHVVGAGGGEEAEALARRMAAMDPPPVRHGMLEQAKLADLLRTCEMFVLPSLYEGVPLVVVEALACGCRPVATALPGVLQDLAPRLGDTLTLVEPPPLHEVDRAVGGDIAAFTQRLVVAMDQALSVPSPRNTEARLAPYRWSSVFRRVEAVWRV